MNKRNRMIVGLATFLVAVSVGVGIAIAVTLFYHHMPAVGASATLTPNCDPLLATPASVTIGSSGQITFDCGGAAGALTVAGGSVAVKPVFLDQGFRSPYVSLWLYASGGSVVTGPCSSRSGAVQLQNNTAMTLSVGSYSYCAEYVDVTNVGLRAFLCRWDA